MVYRLTYVRIVAVLVYAGRPPGSRTPFVTFAESPLAVRVAGVAHCSMLAGGYPTVGDGDPPET